MKLRKLLVFMMIWVMVTGCTPAVEIPLTPASAPINPAATATMPPATPVPTLTPLPTTQPASTQAPTDTPTQSAILSTQVPTTVYMIDPLNGWGLRANRILRTTDGGHTWMNAGPAEAVASQDALTGCFLDKDTAWVVLPEAQASGSGQVFHTINGGFAWAGAPAPFGRAMMQALNPQLLFALVDRGAAAGSQVIDIYRSSDGGATWTPMTHVDPQDANADALPFAGSKSGFVFRDEQHGWVTGFEPMDGFTYLYATSDGGQTWKQQPLPLPAHLAQAQISLEDPRFFTNQEGLILARFATEEGSFLGVYRTEDGGATWQMTTALKATGPFAAASMQDFYVWNQGLLYASHIGGLTWTLMPGAVPGEQPASMQFVDPDHGWLTLVDNDRVRLYMTADQGNLWYLLVEDQ